MELENRGNIINSSHQQGVLSDSKLYSGWRSKMAASVSRSVNITLNKSGIRGHRNANV